MSPLLKDLILNEIKQLQKYSLQKAENSGEKKMLTKNNTCSN